MADGLSKRQVLAGVVTIVLVLGLAGTWLAVAPARAAPIDVNASTSLAVTTASPYKFVQNAIEQVPSNSTINVTVTDVDTLAHTFSILNREGVVIPTSTGTGALNQLFATYGALVSVNVTGSGDVVTQSFHSPAPGWYEFVCLETGHFQQGMYGFIAFGENLPSNLTVTTPSTGPGIAVFIISGTIVTLVVIAIVLGFVVGRRKGSEFEMPPERLGYPEPPVPPAPATPGSPGGPPHAP